MIIFLDLDGTLWQMHRIPQSAKYAIKKAYENGHRFFVNTGRSQSGVPYSLLKELPFDGYCLSAGSEIIIHDKKVLYKPFGKENVQKILDILEPMKVGFSLEGSKRTFQNDLNFEMFKKFAKEDRTGNGFIMHHKMSEIKEEDYDQIMKISIHTHDEASMKDILSQLDKNLTFTPFGNTGGEITHQLYDKASAIRFVKDYYQTNEKTMAVGDSDNDLSMLKEADISIAMGNGNDNAKKIADYITSEIENDGLYNAFKHFELI